MGSLYDSITITNWKQCWFTRDQGHWLWFSLSHEFTASNHLYTIEILSFTWSHSWFTVHVCYWYVVPGMCCGRIILGCSTFAWWIWISSAEENHGYARASSHEKTCISWSNAMHQLGHHPHTCWKKEATPTSFTIEQGFQMSIRQHRLLSIIIIIFIEWSLIYITFLRDQEQAWPIWYWTMMDLLLLKGRVIKWQVKLQPRRHWRLKVVRNIDSMTLHLTDISSRNPRASFFSQLSSRLVDNWS